MPTPESAEAFGRLVATRTRLNEVTKLLNECHARLSLDGQAGRQRYAELQSDWETAFAAFQKATDDFSATVKEIPRAVIAHQHELQSSN